MLKLAEEKLKEVSRYFYNISGIPSVIGAVAGTYIQIITPKTNEHLYFNNNNMIICHVICNSRNLVGVLAY